MYKIYILFFSALASSSQDSSLILWDIVTGDKLKTLETGATDIWTLDFSPDGKHVISGSNAGKILIFSVESGKQEQTLDTRGKFTLSVAYVSCFFITDKYLLIHTDLTSIDNKSRNGVL